MIHRKAVTIIVACLMAVIAVGGIMPPTAQAQVPPFVSIDPDTQTVLPGGTFSIDVVVNSNGELLKACHVEVGYDDTVFTASTPTYEDLLGAVDILIEPITPVVDGLVQYGVGRVPPNAAAAESGKFITIEFEVDPAAAPDTYALDVKNVILLDENNNVIPNVEEVDGQVVIGVGMKGDFTGPDGVPDGKIDFFDFGAFCDAYEG